jgi:hypothetical protein
VEKIRRRVREFLRKQGMYHGDISIADTCEVFLSEMEGLAGKRAVAMRPATSSGNCPGTSRSS